MLRNKIIFFQGKLLQHTVALSSIYPSVISVQAPGTGPKGRAKHGRTHGSHPQGSCGLWRVQPSQQLSQSMVSTVTRVFTQYHGSFTEGTQPSLKVRLLKNGDLWVGSWRATWSGTEGVVPSEEGMNLCKGPGAVNLSLCWGCILLQAVRACGSQPCLSWWPLGFASPHPSHPLQANHSCFASHSFFKPWKDWGWACKWWVQGLSSQSSLFGLAENGKALVSQLSDSFFLEA